MSGAICGQRLFEQPLVSICVPTYNAEKTILSTIQSILNQTYRNLEIIIIDNASTDNTWTLLSKLNDPRMKIHKNAENVGWSKNFDRCVEVASGKYVAIFHADDLYMPDMVQRQVQAFQENPTVGAVFTMAKRINSRNEVIGETNLPSELKRKKVYRFDEIFISILKNLNFLVCPSCMVRGELYKELLPFDGERFASSLDLDMWLRILERHPVAILEDKLIHYRISDTQGSYQYNHLRTEQADFFKVMDYYLSAKSDIFHIPQSALNGYEFLKSIDYVRCAVNYVIMSQPQDAKKLLKRAFSVNAFFGAMGNIKKPKFIGYWFIGMPILGLVYLGLGRYLGRSLRWLLYEQKKMQADSQIFFHQ